MIQLKRVYEKPSRKDGLRVLVDRLWPRGLTKERAAVKLWLKDLAPSTELRNGSITIRPNGNNSRSVIGRNSERRKTRSSCCTKRAKNTLSRSCTAREMRNTMRRWF